MLNLSQDLVFGAKAIADLTGFSPRRVYRMAELKQLPVFKKGGQLIARKSEIEAALSSPESKAQFEQIDSQ